MAMKSTDWIIVVIILLLFVGAVAGMGFQVEWLITLCAGLLTAIISGVVLRLELQKPKQKLIAPVSVLVLGVIITGTGLIQWGDPQFLEHMLHDNDNFFGSSL